MKTYKGTLKIFSEMGSGSSLYFEDSKAQYLKGYDCLDLSYFFHLKDEFFNVTISDDKQHIIYHGDLTFTYDSKKQIIIPKEFDVEKLFDIIKIKHNIIFSSNKILFKDKIILDTNVSDETFIKNEIITLLQTDPKDLDDKLRDYKIAISHIKIAFDLVNPQSSLNEFLNFIITPQEQFFNYKPLEIILRGDGHLIVNFLKH